MLLNAVTCPVYQPSRTPLKGVHLKIKLKSFAWLTSQSTTLALNDMGWNVAGKCAQLEDRQKRYWC
jgi:hypothetical protein